MLTVQRLVLETEMVGNRYRTRIHRREIPRICNSDLIKNIHLQVQITIQRSTGSDSDQNNQKSDENWSAEW